jgi:hypothetical protein
MNLCWSAPVLSRTVGRMEEVPMPMITLELIGGVTSRYQAPGLL